MGCKKTRLRRQDRRREMLGEGSRRRVEAENEELRFAQQKRHERYIRLEKSRWGCSQRRGRSARNIRKLVRDQIVAFEKACNGDLLVGKQVLEGFVGHWRMGKIRNRTTLETPKNRRVQDMIMKNIGEAGETIKGQHSQDDVIAKSVLCNMLISSEIADARLLSKASQVLHIGRQSLAKHASNRAAILSSAGRMRRWALKGRKTRSDAMSSELKTFIIQFWTDNTRPSPCAKHIFKGHPIHFLHVTQTELYTRFREEFPEERFPGVRDGDHFHIGQRRFESLKPNFVRKEKDRSVCCCKYHVEMDFMKDGMNLLRRKHGRTCVCECISCTLSYDSNANLEGLDFGRRCRLNEDQFSSVREMVHSTLCPKSPENKFHELDCMMGSCNNCGVSKHFKICEEDKIHEELMKWKSFEYEMVGKDAEGKDKKRIKLKYKETVPKEFIDTFLKKVPEFIKHDFTARWQDKEFRKCLGTFPIGTVVSIIDYAENYSIQNQDEIQSQHWTSEQITILVHIVYYHAADSTPECRKIKKEAHFYISDDRVHDNYFVQKAFDRLYGWLVDEVGVRFNRHWVWSDGAPTQFKNNIAFYFISRYAAITRGHVRMTWHFFGTGHGKGEHDGMGAVIKRWLRHYQLDRQGEKLVCALDAVGLLRLNLSTGVHSFMKKRKERSAQIKRIFWHVPDGEVCRDENLQARTVQGTKSFHSVMGGTVNNPRIIYTRPFSCFCPPCLEEDWTSCENQNYVGAGWEMHEIIPIGSEIPSDMQGESSHNRDEIEYDNTHIGGEHDDLSFALEIGSFFAIVADEDDEGVQYYILQCTGIREILKVDETHLWSDQVFLKGEMIVRGRYMELEGKTSLKYKFASSTYGDAIVSSHHVRAINLQMIPESETERRRWRRKKGSPPIYSLAAEVHEAILGAIETPIDIAMH